MANETLNTMKQKKVELKKEIEDLKTNFNKGIETLMQELPRRMKEVEDRVQNDIVGKQTGGFKMQKELVLLRRDKMTLEKEIEECVEKINKLEDSLYGKRIFDLEPADKGLDNISDLNLRSDRFALMKNSQLLH
jgi:predicted  nucleic acid-binding Zn-ribbon protein